MAWRSSSWPARDPLGLSATRVLSADREPLEASSRAVRNQASLPRDVAQKDRSGIAMMGPMPGKHRLLRLVTPFVAVMIFQAMLAGLSLEVLSSVRAYVGGEGLWSKGQKDAIHFISLYSQTGDEQFFSRFKMAVAVPLADRAARYALEQTRPDLNAARDGFLGGGNHPDDIPGMIWLFRHFQDIPYMANAIR